ANNSSSGILLSDGSRNTILGNSLFHNAGFGIDLANTRRTGNHLGDTDNGPKELQNFPVLTGGLPAVGSLPINSTLKSTSNTTYRLEFFHTGDFSPANQPQAGAFLGSTNVTTDSSGNGSFSFTIATNGLPSGFITATATDPAGNTSELSDGVVTA